MPTGRKQSERKILHSFMTDGCIRYGVNAYDDRVNAYDDRVNASGDRVNASGDLETLM